MILLPPSLIDATENCALCGVRCMKTELWRVEINEPYAFDWVCDDCYVAGKQN